MMENLATIFFLQSRCEKPIYNNSIAFLKNPSHRIISPSAERQTVGDVLTVLYIKNQFAILLRLPSILINSSLFALIHLASFLTPSLKIIFGSHPNSFFAFEMSQKKIR